MDNQTQTQTVRPMRFGRAMHMTLERASDADLERAIQVLDEFDTAGKASAYTQMLIDDRIADINDEGDRRAGVEPVYVERLPREFYFPHVVTAADAVDGLVPGETSDI